MRRLFQSSHQSCIHALYLVVLVIFSPSGTAQDNATPKSTYGDLRIISADLGTTKLLQALNLESGIVAVDVTSANLPEFKHLPNIGYHRQLSTEGLLSLNGTLLIGSTHMGPERTLDTLEKSGVQILSYETPYTTKQLLENIAALATTLGAEQQAETLASHLQQTLASIEPSKSGQASNESAVFLLDMGDKTTIAGSGTGGNAFLELLGMKNLADFKSYRDTSMEALVALQPDVIIMGGRSSSRSATNNSDSKDKPDPVFALLKKTGARQVYMDASTLVAGLSIEAISEASRVRAELVKLSQEQLQATTNDYK
jgi:iron complex transport system substrate-binding protein